MFLRKAQFPEQTLGVALAARLLEREARDVLAAQVEDKHVVAMRVVHLERLRVLELCDPVAKEVEFEHVALGGPLHATNGGLENLDPLLFKRAIVGRDLVVQVDDVLHSGADVDWRKELLPQHTGEKKEEKNKWYHVYLNNDDADQLGMGPTRL